jgi:hypothetical protein
VATGKPRSPTNAALLQRAADVLYREQARRAEERAKENPILVLDRVMAELEDVADEIGNWFSRKQHPERIDTWGRLRRANVKLHHLRKQLIRLRCEALREKFGAQETAQKESARCDNTEDSKRQLRLVKTEG